MSPVSFRTTLGTATGILSSAPALTFSSSTAAAVLTPHIRASKSTKPGFAPTSFVRRAGHKLSFTPPKDQIRSCINFLPPWKLAPSSFYRAAQAPTHKLLNSQSRKQLQAYREYSTSSLPDTSPDTYPNTTSSMNGEARAKRKHSPVSASDRPAKHLKPESTVLTPGDETPANGTVYDVENGEDITPIVALGAAQADSPEWQATIESVVKSVVSIHFCQTCSFDTDLSMCSQATGFVVDAERGYILTNRHVVCAGPFWGYCIFDNHEEVSMKP